MPVRHAVHSAQQGKGGCGKSVSTALLGMYKISKGELPLCIDTDPLNPTFSNYEKLNVRQLNIMEGDEINQRKLDTLIQWIDEAGDRDVIIDNGAPSFIPLSSYMISQQIPALLYEMGKQLVIHISIVGGRHMITPSRGSRPWWSSIRQKPVLLSGLTRIGARWNPIRSAIRRIRSVPDE